MNELFRAEALPVLQNRLFNSQEAAQKCVKGDVVLVQDSGTGLIYNAAFDPGLLEYNEEYQNEQALSPEFRRHLVDVSDIVGRWLGGGSIIEVGCGKGFFIQQLLERGFQVEGIDPAYEGNNPRIHKVRFESGLDLAADGLILRHVLEHMQSPLEFLRGLAEANDGGRIYIEVPSLDWICEHRAWYDVFYEHVNYFRNSDLCLMFGKVMESGFSFGGQYQYVVADLNTLRDPVGLEKFSLPSDFLSGLAKTARRFVEGKRFVIWGGSSKGVIAAVYLQREGVVPDCMIDINPAKQGRYAALTGVRILSPESAFLQIPEGTDVLVMNPNYMSEIVNMSGNKYRYQEVT